MTRKVYIETVGCQMNVLDSELVIGALRKQGYSLAQKAADAEVILFNTCSVRAHAEEKIYSALGRLKGHMDRHPEKVLGILGCMAQKDQDVILKRAPHVDLVCGTGQLERVPELIDAVRSTGRPQMALSLGRKDASRTDVEASFISYDPVRDATMRPTPFQAYLRIQIGCDKFCTYCVVPSTRGPEQSRPPDHIYAEARQLADQGCREITLLGQTVNSYRFDHGDGRTTRLSDLITTLSDISGLDRIRFVTSFPLDMTNDLIDAVRDLPKLVKYFHVPAQSGCDEMLTRMKRIYTVAQYDEMRQRIRERAPEASVSSDFIVGFCGETEESFQKSVDMVDRSAFKNSYIFKYSPREGTRAFEKFEDDVPEETKKRRNNDLLVAQNRQSLAIHRAYIGKEVEVLVEGPSLMAKRESKRQGQSYAPDAPVQMTGHSMHDLITVFDGMPRLAGSLVRVRIEEATAFTLLGQIVTTENSGRLDESRLAQARHAASRPVATQKPGTIVLPMV
jgi:tRNA-2-methylthio-N6-dimethylallyladenosine synthase